MAQYRRSIILINPAFQLRFCAYICGAFMALCFVYPMIVAALFDYCIHALVANPNGPEIQTLLQTKHEVIALIIGAEVAFLVLAFLIGLFISHRIAGPIYKLSKSMDEYGRGSWQGSLAFREKDYFSEVADTFNRMTGSIQERVSHEEQLIASAASRIEHALPDTAPETRQELQIALESLKKIRQQRAPHP